MVKTAGNGNPEALADFAKKIFSGVTAVFLCVVFVAFPLYYHNYYFDILVAKYQFYWISAVAYCAVCLISAVIFCILDYKRCNGVNTKRFFAGFSIRELKKQLLVYKAVVLFWLFAALATVFSDYVYESFWGNEGRYSGLFLITLYVVTLVLVGKLGRAKKWYLDLFMVSAVLVCLLGITDYFRLDVLGWKTNVNSNQLDSFTSTLGNINTYTAFVAMAMGVSCGLFLTEKNLFRCIWNYAVVIVVFFAIITGQSDNAYLALGALFAFAPFLAFRSRSGLGRYAVLAASFMTVIKIIDEINKAKADKVIGLSGLFNFLVNYEHLEVIVIALWMLVAVLYVWNWSASRRGKKEEIGKWLRIVWSCVLAAAALVVLYVVYDANFGNNPERYASLSQYLIFNDNWGTGRGYCWRIGWESYRKLPLLHQLFGFGPDTFGILTWDYREEAIALKGVYFENAHNEYLQYLVTIGPFGVLSYIVFLAAGIMRMARSFQHTPWILAPGLAVLCYGAQAAVNINLPIGTPIMWALFALGLSLTRPEPGKKEDILSGQPQSLTTENPGTEASCNGG